MNDDKPSIAKLTTIEQAMVRRPWTKSPTELAALRGGPQGSAQVRCDAASDVVPSGCLIPYFILHASDAEGIAELRNAAPLLLEIAAAVMQRSIALTAIEEDRSKAWDEVYAADLRIKAALAKVQP